MATKRALLLLVCITCVFSFDEEAPKHKEKRSPKPQFSQFSQFLFGQASKLIPEVIVPNAKSNKKVHPFISMLPDNLAGGIAKTVLLVGTEQNKQELGCQVHIRRLQEKQPVFFSIGNPDSLMLPNDGQLTWAQGQTSWIACPKSSDGPSNSISGKNRVSAEIECVTGYLFRYVHDNTFLSIIQVSCVIRATGNEQTISMPMDQCPGTHKIAGFDVPFPNLGNRFFVLYNICFDENAAIPMYTYHKVFGNETKHKCIATSTRPAFKKSGYTPGVDMATAYTQNNQIRRLTALFASDSDPQGSADMYFVANFLQRGHLTPDADMIFTTWQWSTYFFINVVGMWDTINNGNWKYLEENVRAHANDSKKNLDIYTGTYGTLSLCSLDDHCRDFTLSDGRMPVPKWLWKIVKSPELNAAIALVVSNNPFDSEDPICNLGDQSFGWDTNINSTSTPLGAVSYCSVQDLHNVVGNIPHDAFALNILPYLIV